ncbi:MAG TPA: AI-2E family transporter [Phycisphaerae bacterium]|nr:AI-2E family transporter [Phycisphaerales bacterium]HRX87196.1 AI-2E family transporter [Phycisphaerae bacterium]
MTQHDASTPLRRAGHLATALLVAAALYFGREFLIPLALAVFISFLLAPLVRAVERLRVGRVVAVITVVVAGFGLPLAVGGLVATQASDFVDAIPQYRSNIRKKVRQLRGSLPTVSKASQAVEEIRKEIKDGIASPPANADSSGAPADESATEAPTPTPTPAPPAPEPVKVEVVAPKSDPLALASRLVGPVVHPLASAGITLVLVMFFLVYREDLRDRVIRLAGRTRIYVTTAALNESGRRVTRYLGAQLLANTVNGVAIGVGLLVIGVPDPLLWGLLAGVLRFIPFLGTWIAVLFPLALSAAVAPGWLQPLAVAGWFLVVDLCSANFIEPYLYGARIGASPMAILFAFLFWTWLWGAVGLLLATPITVCLIVLGKHIPALEFFYVLLSDEPALEPKVRFYQRLLALDRTEALETARRFARDHSAVELIDEMVLPALAQLENDRIAKDVDEPRTALTLGVVDRIIDEVCPALAAAEEDAPAPWLSGGTALLVPGAGDFDPVALRLLQCVGAHQADQLEAVSNAALTAEILDRVRTDLPAAVILTTIEPRDVSRLKYLAKRLAVDAPTCPVLGLCSSVSEPARKRCQRLGRLNVRMCSGTEHLIELLRALPSVPAATTGSAS